MIRDHPRERTRSGTRLLTGFETYILNRINDGSAGSGLIDTLPFHMRAEALSRKGGHVGAVAFARSGDPATGEFGDAVVIRKFGTVPDDLSVM